MRAALVKLARSQAGGGEVTMRCDSCGCDIPEGQEVETTRQESSGILGGGLTTHTDLVYHCPRCAGESNRFWNTLIWIGAGIAILGLCLWARDWFR